MNFKMKYVITPMYLPSNTKRRSGIKADKIKFSVAHDTGNPNSTAKNNVDYYTKSANELSASAHLFVDDTHILECIPMFTGTPEKAWQVLYDKPLDNQKYGAESNNAAFGVELCYGSKINAQEAYKRFIWIFAYGAYKFNLNVNDFILGHFQLDPARRTDPNNALNLMGKTFEQFLKDVIAEYNDCLSEGDDDVEHNAMKIYYSDGTPVKVDNYKIDGSTYVNLRDILSAGVKSIKVVQGDKIYLIKQ